MRLNHTASGDTIRKYIQEQGWLLRFIPSTPLRVDQWVFSERFDKDSTVYEFLDLAETDYRQYVRHNKNKSAYIE